MKPTKKIALIGSAPSSVALAPYDDPTWEIWACSPGSVPHLKRVNAFFELHRWEPGKPWFALDYLNFLAGLKCPVYMIAPVAMVPMSVAYPKDDILKEFGPWDFGSTLSWMMALAIKQGATEISFYGVDMSAKEEYIAQRSGCHALIKEARRRGIIVNVPPESDLMQPFKLYGFCETHPMHIKLLARKEELLGRKRDAEARMASARDEFMFYCGAVDDLEYMLLNWISDPLQQELAYKNPEPKVETAPEAPKPEPRKRRGRNGVHLTEDAHGG